MPKVKVSKEQFKHFDSITEEVEELQNIADDFNLDIDASELF